MGASNTRLSLGGKLNAIFNLDGLSQSNNELDIQDQVEQIQQNNNETSQISEFVEPAIIADVGAGFGFGKK